MGTFNLTVCGSDIKTINIPSKPFYGQPVMVMFDNRILVAPDMIPKLSDSLIVILFTKDSNKANIMRPINNEEYQVISKMPNVKRIKAKLV